MWPFTKRVRRGSPTLPSAQERLAEAEAALEQTEQLKGQANRQVNFFQELRAGWDRVHERNNLAALFAEEYRRTHGK